MEVAGAVIMRTSTQSSTPMVPTDNLFWVFLWSVYDRGWWTLSKPSQAKVGREGGREADREAHREAGREGGNEGGSIGGREGGRVLGKETEMQAWRGMTEAGREGGRERVGRLGIWETVKGR